MKSYWKINQPEFEADLLNKMLRVSPWSGHRDFVYDLINFIEPVNIVELGTHYGCSFFAMCQSVKDNRLLNSKLIGIDTWKGDEQAGYYGDEVLTLVNDTVSNFFSGLRIELDRNLFDDAVSKYKDECFDLIHIDGLHTYEAVRNDFFTWLPKLQSNGIVLFHDIASQLKYGTDDFWSHIKSEYKNRYFEFPHSWGLGVLFPKGNMLYNALLEQNILDKIKC